MPACIAGRSRCRYRPKCLLLVNTRLRRPLQGPTVSAPSSSSPWLGGVCFRPSSVAFGLLPLPRLAGITNAETQGHTVFSMNQSILFVLSVPGFDARIFKSFSQTYRFDRKEPCQRIDQRFGHWQAKPAIFSQRPTRNGSDTSAAPCTPCYRSLLLRAGRWEFPVLSWSTSPMRGRSLSLFSGGDLHHA